MRRLWDTPGPAAFHHEVPSVSETQFDFEIPNSGTIAFKNSSNKFVPDACIIRLRPMAFHSF
jgi:hypothetical protein